MTPTRIRNLGVLAAVLFVVANLLVRMSYEDLPRLPTLAGATLAVLAIVDACLAIALRPRFEHRKDTTPVPPLTAVRVLVIAKASSVLGAIMFGAWLGAGGYVLPKAGELDAAAHDTGACVVGALCALALIAAALWLERCCRAPDQDDDSEREPTE